MSELKNCPFECDGAPSPYYGTDCKITNKVCKKDGCKVFTAINEQQKRIAELEVERAKLREALISAKVVMDYLGESMNNMDIVTEQDEAAVNPLFETVRDILNTIPDYKEKFENGLQQACRRAQEALKGGE